MDAQELIDKLKDQNLIDINSYNLRKSTKLINKNSFLLCRNKATKLNAVVRIEVYNDTKKEIELVEQETYDSHEKLYKRLKEVNKKYCINPIFDYKVKIEIDHIK